MFLKKITIYSLLFVLMVLPSMALSQSQLGGSPSSQANMRSKLPSPLDQIEIQIPELFSGSPDIVETAQDAGIFNTLLAALEAADLVDALKGPGPFTVFAPSDEAFAKLPARTIHFLLLPQNVGLLTSVLTYHVVPGLLPASDVLLGGSTPTLNGDMIDFTILPEGAFAEDTLIVATDIMASNGIIHVVDKVLIPPSSPVPGVLDIPGLASQNPSFQFLVKALVAADLVEALQGIGPFTVFAPTDEAFAQIDGALLRDLLKPQNKTALQSILLYHVAPGYLTAEDVVGLSAIPTLNGKEISIKVRGNSVKADDAAVIATDILARNGVIHVVNKVLIPDS